MSRKAVSYAQACREAVVLLTNEDVWAHPDHDTAVALRALAALVEQCEAATKHRGIPSRDRALQLCHQLAAGFTDPKTATAGGPG